MRVLDSLLLVAFGAMLLGACAVTMLFGAEP
jgi:hypothetical protein